MQIFYHSCVDKCVEILIHSISPFIVRVTAKQHSCIGEPQWKVTILMVQPLLIKPCCSHRQEEPTFILTVRVNTGKRNLVCSMNRLSHYLQKTFTLSTPQELATSSFKSFGVGCCSRHFSRNTTRLHHILYWNTAHLNPLLELPMDCLLAALLHLDTGSRDSPTVAWAALRSCGCTEQEWAAQISVLLLHLEWDGHTAHVLLSQGSNTGCSPHRLNFRLFIK